MNNTEQLLTNKLGIYRKVLAITDACEKKLADSFAELDDIMAYNQYKVLAAFQKNRVSDTHFAWNTGYGYDDAGRSVVEKVYADIFGAEAALVRTQIVNGTHVHTSDRYNCNCKIRCNC